MEKPHFQFSLAALRLTFAVVAGVVDREGSFIGKEHDRMKRFLTRLLFVIAVTALFATPVSAETKFFSYAFGKAFRVTISDAAIAKSPAWNEDSENPPLSAKKALRLANELKESLVNDSETHKWKLRTLALHPVKGAKWCWLATYEAEPQHFSSGPPIELRLVVLMDGTAIKPVIGGDSD